MTLPAVERTEQSAPRTASHEAALAPLNDPKASEIFKKVGALGAAQSVSALYNFDGPNGAPSIKQSVEASSVKAADPVTPQPSANSNRPFDQSMAPVSDQQFQIMGLEDKTAKSNYQYDAQGRPISKDIDSPSGKTHIEYDPATGHIKSKDITRADGSTEHDEFKYDPFTGKRISLDIKRSNGQEIHEEYDRKTGNKRSLDEKFKDGQIRHTDYDPATGKPKSVDLRYSDKTTVHTNFDANGKPLTEDMKRPDGSTQHTVFDPATGKLKSVDSTSSDKSAMHVEYDAMGRVTVSDETRPSGKKIHTEFDPATGNKKVMDILFRDGMGTEHIVYDAQGKIVTDTGTGLKGRVGQLGSVIAGAVAGQAGKDWWTQ